MPTKTPVTYLSQYPNLRVGRHRFNECRFTTSDPKVIAKFDASIERGGRCLFWREDQPEHKEPAQNTSPAKVEPVQWDQFNVTDLKNHASHAGITGASSMKKDELVTALAGTDYRPG